MNAFNFIQLNNCLFCAALVWIERILLNETVWINWMSWGPFVSEKSVEFTAFGFIHLDTCHIRFKSSRDKWNAISLIFIFNECNWNGWNLNGKCAIKISSIELLLFFSLLFCAIVVRICNSTTFGNRQRKSHTWMPLVVHSKTLFIWKSVSARNLQFCYEKVQSNAQKILIRVILHKGGL